MRIAILAFGSRGDVQPYVALGAGLRDAGHRVQIVSHQNFEGLVTSHGLAFSPVVGNVQEIVESEEMRALLEKGNFIAITRHTTKLAQQAAIQWAKDSIIACRESEVLIAGIGGLFIGHSLSEKLGIPLIQAHLLPFAPTSDFPGVLFPEWLTHFGDGINRLSHHLTRQIMWQGSRVADTQMRKELFGLSPASFFGPYRTLRRQRCPILYGISPVVLPRPADWDERTHLTGYWFLDAESDWSPPAALTDFLQAGSQPIYVGFGSMGSRNPEQTAQLVMEALKITKQRAILLTGWAGLRQENVPENIFMVDSIPHSWLFSHVAAVVHHGGAGTTAAGLRAGVPNIVIPFFADQPFWGERVAALGVGPRPIARKKLTAELLAQAIQTAVDDSTMRLRAAELGAKIQAEKGIANAVAILEKWRLTR